jgi:hypothetical protein
MSIHSEKAFYDCKRGSKVVAEDKFRFNTFVLLIEEWLKQS